MSPCIGIRLEDKNEWERRVPLAPVHVKRLVEDDGLVVEVQRSSLRAFRDEEYEAAGATLVDALDDCPVVFAVKEIPEELLRRGRTYVYFSHVIKGQAYNMPMLRRLMELGCTLVDYEKIADAAGRRLIFFGFHAGLAGMIETLWGLGQRMEHEGLDSPLAEIRHAHEYADLADAKARISEIGERLAAGGLPDGWEGPLVVGFAGYGNVSRGAQEVLSFLPVERVAPEDLPSLAAGGAPRDRIHAVVFEERHLVERSDGADFDLQDYFKHPERYHSIFERHAAHLDVLVNGIYWTDRYPRLLTRAWARRAWADGKRPRLRVVGDISCDIDGAIEFTTKATDPGVPCFTWDPATGESVDGIAGPGPVVMAVDNLPCELPRESSTSFGDALAPFVPAMARADYGVGLDELALPEEIRKAIIVHRGELTKDYAYLRKYLEA